MTVVWLSPQKTIFSTGTPVAAATVAPILATNTIPSATTAGKSAALLFLAGKNEACVVSCLFLSQRRPERERAGEKESQLSPQSFSWVFENLWCVWTGHCWRTPFLLSFQDLCLTRRHPRVRLLPWRCPHTHPTPPQWPPQTSQSVSAVQPADRSLKGIFCSTTQPGLHING